MGPVYSPGPGTSDFAKSVRRERDRPKSTATRLRPANTRSFGLYDPGPAVSLPRPVCPLPGAFCMVSSPYRPSS